MNPRIVRVALTETRNAYAPMPARVDQLGELAERLDDVRAANVEHLCGLIDQAADAGAQVVGLGELCTGPYFAITHLPMWRGLAEDAATGPSVAAFRAKARERGVIVVAPIYELDAATERRFNTAVVIDEGGELLGRYRKCHIPDGSNEQGSFRESYYYEASTGEAVEHPGNIADNPFFPVFETSVGRLGVAICYDRHFDGVIRSLAHGGAEIILVPAVTFGATSRRMWRIEAEVDAIRHRVYIAPSNRRGAEPPWNQEFFGDSFFVGPAGPVAAIEGTPEGLVIGDLDLRVLGEKDPSGWALKHDRQPLIYTR